jgi:type VI protein secretion system component Hcp
MPVCFTLQDGNDKPIVVGNSKLPWHAGWLEADSVQFSGSRSSTVPTVGRASDRTAPAPAAGDIEITRSVDSISPTLFKFSVSSRRFTLQVDLLKEGARGYEVFLQLTCKDTLISSYRVSSGGSAPAEMIVFNFIQINYTTMEFDHPGKTAMIRRSVESYNNLA